MESQHRIQSLDGFRGLAIFLVTTYRFGSHAFTEDIVGRLPSKLFSVGAAGVDFFFVLSGFLITGLLFEAKEKKGYYSRFYGRRALRIFPLYFATLIVFLILLPCLGNTRVADTICGSSIHLWLYTTNLSIAWHNEWFYGAFNHFWSLAVEEQFYLVWPIAVALMNPKKLARVCSMLFVLLAAARIFSSFAEIGEVTEKSFTLFRMDGLLLGAIASVIYRSRIDVGGGAVSDRKGWDIGLAAWFICYLISLPLADRDYSIRYSIVSLVAFCLLLSTLASGPGSWQRKLLEAHWLRSLGKFSYAMYIFQGLLVPLTEPYLSPSTTILGACFYFVVMFTLTYFLSVFSWYIFESWFLRLKDRFATI